MKPARQRGRSCAPVGTGAWKEPSQQTRRRHWSLARCPARPGRTALSVSRPIAQFQDVSMLRRSALRAHIVKQQLARLRERHLAREVSTAGQECLNRRQLILGTTSHDQALSFRTRAHRAASLRHRSRSSVLIALPGTHAPTTQPRSRGRALQALTDLRWTVSRVCCAPRAPGLHALASQM